MKQIKTFSSLVLIGLLFSATGMAQSGRRKTAPPPPPETVKESAPLPTASAPKPVSMISLEVGIDRFDSFSRISLSNYNGVYDSFVDRLSRSPSVKVIPTNINMSRGDAVKKTKANKEGHVIWLQVGLDRIGADQNADANIRDVFIEYVVYAPATAKIVAQGRTYPQAHRYKLGVPTTRTPTIVGDYLYNQAAQEAAERVLSALDLSTKPLPRR